VPEYQHHAERAVIAGLMMVEDSVEIVSPEVNPADFYLAACRAALAQAMILHETGDAPTPVTLATLLYALPTGEEVWLAELYNEYQFDMSAYTEAGLRASARIVRAYAERRREVQSLGAQAQQVMEGNGKEPRQPRQQTPGTQRLNERFDGELPAL
jgi:replicative DNA helicase